MASKNRRNRRSAQPGIPTRTRQSPVSENVVPRVMDEEAGAFSREGVESIVVAILLALMFRAFEAEAFVIPTGSMAPTLRGRHKDVECPQCGERWQAGSSLNVELGRGPVVATTCPLCRFPRKVDPHRMNDSSFSGDRILVNKFAYQFGDPKRWDVIVFKFPGNAKQNYIKRLVGLPNETLRVRGGDVFAKPADETEFTILRKPPSVQLTLLQPVFDSEHIPQAVIDADWPASWHSTDESWNSSQERLSHVVDAGNEVAWLNYRHLPLSNSDWKYVGQGRLPPGIRERKGQLVTDFYAYNAYQQNFRPNLLYHDVRVRQREEQFLADSESIRRFGQHWVGDLAFECTAKVKSDKGQLLLQLVEGGKEFTCKFDLATGQATLGTRDGSFVTSGGDPSVTALTTNTAVKGTGTYRLRFSNVDEQLRLWVNEKIVDFSFGGKQHSGAYVSFDPHPAYSQGDAGDLHPVRIGCANAKVEVTQLRVLRDNYYTALTPNTRSEYSQNPSADRIEELFTTPAMWAESDLFAFADANDARRGRATIEFPLEEDQFFPMGDNSPQSKDARLWSEGQPSLHLSGFIEPGAYIDRNLLIGKAFLIYWPHGWYPGNVNTVFPFLPNVGLMGRIR